MTAKTLTKINKEQQASILKYVRTLQQSCDSDAHRARYTKVDKQYSREVDTTDNKVLNKLLNASGNTKRIQNMTVPVVMPQVESAVTYQSSVFLASTPIFGAVSSPEHMDAAIALETTIDAQATKGKWVLHLEKFLRDGFKYNVAMLEVDWVTHKVPNFSADSGTAKQAIWAGNSVKRLDPYNTFYDTRVAPTDVSEKGAFAGYIELITDVELKKYIQDLDDRLPNASDAFAAPPSNSFFVPDIVEDNSSAQTQSWSAWETGSTGSGGRKAIKYQNSYERKTIYVRLMPAIVGLTVPEENTPQIWKFVIINDSVLLYAERQTNAHDLIPILIGQPYDDGLGYQTKSLAQNVEVMQSVSSSLLNGALDARRKAVFDRTFYDPTKISSKDINNPNPIANIPIRAAAYGTNIRDAFVQTPFTDNQSGLILSEMHQISAMADLVTGQNKAQQGQFVKGNKTGTEYSDIMANANGKSQAISLVLEAQIFTPLKHLLKINILQYQSTANLFSTTKNKFVKVDPSKLRQAVLEFKLTDGLLPSSKLLALPAFQAAMQMISATPEVAATYNMGSLMSYLFKSQGADIGAFEKPITQINYERAVQQWQQLAMASMEKGLPFQTPQPTPEQYNWSGDPNSPEIDSTPKQEKTILEQYMSTDSPQTAQTAQTGDTV